MIAIVAVDDRFGIGLDGGLLFRCKEDQEFFKAKTLNKTVVMGRKTYLSLPKSRRPLPNRTNIVMTTDHNFHEEGVVTCNSVEHLLELTKNLLPDNIFVIGGEEIYRLLLDYCDKVYITRFKAERPADTFFPYLDEMPKWKITDRSSTYNFEGIEYNFLTYEK